MFRKIIIKKKLPDQQSACFIQNLEENILRRFRFKEKFPVKEDIKIKRLQKIYCVSIIHKWS